LFVSHSIAGMNAGGERLPHDRMNTVGADDEVAVAERGRRLQRRPVADHHAGACALRLQQLQELEAADRAKAVAVDVDGDVAVHDPLDRPGFGDARQRSVHRRRIARQEFERTVREHDAEAERCAGFVLLDHAHVEVGAPALGQQREQQARGSGAGDTDAHGTERRPRTVLAQVDLAAARSPAEWRPFRGMTIDDCDWRRISCNSRIARSTPTFAASPYLSTASASVLASISKLIGSGPIDVINCASPW
jgi:hypothetical protein